MTDTRTQPSAARERVLNAAYQLFLRNGLTSVSMQQIADEAGITKATLYHHFRDKNDLFLETVRLAIATNEQALTNQLADAQDMGAILRRLLTYMSGSERADLQRLVADFKTHIPVTEQQALWRQFRFPWHLIMSAVQTHITNDEQDALFISRYIYGAVAGITQLNRFEQEAHPMNDAILDRMVETMLHGITPK